MTTKKTKKINSLYIHIPFCSRICSYCDFVKVLDNKKFKKLYVSELIKDIDALIQKRYFFNTIYLGGGTPTALEDDELEMLLCALNRVKSDTCEFTIEGNPESITESKLKIMKEYGVNRISIGVQSFKTHVLDIINRNYNIDIFALIKLVKKYISNINVDFIYGLPNQTFDDIKDDLNDFIKLDVNHISIYSLILEPGTVFYNQKVEEVSDEVSREYYDYIVNFLRRYGYKRYEVSNFSKPGYESKHNLTYRKDEEYIALGIGASGYENGVRYKNSGSLTKYIKGYREREEEIVSKEDDIEYFLITNLRLEDGFALNEFYEKFGIDLLKSKEAEVNELLKSNLILIDNDYLKCTDEGIALLDMVLLKLI